MSRDEWLIVGLGNPGKIYNDTRHNIGFRVLDRLAERFGKEWCGGESGVISSFAVEGTSVTLLKPTTWMNRSGLAVSNYLGSIGIGMSGLVVVCDDVALPDGRLRIRTRGSSGGHRGLASIIEHLDSTEFTRLRIGVGSSRDHRVELSDFVLEKLSSDSLNVYRAAVLRACDALIVIVKKGIQAAMTEYNRVVTVAESDSRDEVAPNTGGVE